MVCSRSVGRSIPLMSSQLDGSVFTVTPMTVRCGTVRDGFVLQRACRSRCPGRPRDEKRAVTHECGDIFGFLSSTVLATIAHGREARGPDFWSVVGNLTGKPFRDFE